mmetsp:Transcript_9739/g.18798  ORF Transcript_9739/g.18798 Transcript_9739/m.18798 type:complete len:410 (+) Transcript_9739:69-1298(+)
MSSLPAKDAKEAYMAELIERLSADESLQSYQELQAELLHRVQRDAVLMDDAAWKEFEAKEDSVFDRVEQHKQNGENMLDLYAEQFQKKHLIDHKTFTERWLLEQTGQYIELEKVLEKPSFQDLVGVYDIQPITAYVASKMVIDEDDFMGVYDLGKNQSNKHKPGTYCGVAEECASMGKDHQDAVAQDASEQELQQKAAEEEADSKEGQISGTEAPVTPTVSFCCSERPVAAHALGQGQFLQFKLRRENVIQYLDESLIAKRLKMLIPEDPKEPIYVFTASENGVMRFHPWGGIQRKLWHGYGDSEKVEAFPVNIAHAGTYGCFCFGVIYKERENYADPAGGMQRGGRTFVMRYNRWATDNEPIYAMVRQRADERDISVPKQESTMKHYQRVLDARMKGFFGMFSKSPKE